MLCRILFLGLMATFSLVRGEQVSDQTGNNSANTDSLIRGEVGSDQTANDRSDPETLAGTLKEPSRKKVRFAEGDSLNRVREYDPIQPPSEVSGVKKTGLDRYAVEEPESKYSNYVSPRIGSNRIELKGFYETDLIDRSQLKKQRSDGIEILKNDLKKKGQDPNDYNFYAKPYVLKSDDDGAVLAGNRETIVGEKTLKAGARDVVKSAGNALSKAKQKIKTSLLKTK